MSLIPSSPSNPNKKRRLNTKGEYQAIIKNKTEKGMEIGKNKLSLVPLISY